MDTWTYQPSEHVPFRDPEVLRRMRALTRGQLTQHPNPDLKIQIVKADEIGMVMVADMVRRIRQSSVEDTPLVLILPNPCPTYRHVARMINALRIDCRNLYCFAMDEYADQDGRIAPDTWRFGFVHAMKDYFYNRLDPELRPPEDHFIGPTNANLDSYGSMIEDRGGADMCYSGPGWTGHLAFIEPDAPEFSNDLEEWKQQGTRIVTLSPFTLAQNSLHGSFGQSGDIAALPPKAATIGPREVIAARNRIDSHAITVHGTAASWQRMISRLVLHGPVTPLLPTSLHQLLRTDVYISEENAAPIEPDWDAGY